MNRSRLTCFVVSLLLLIALLPSYALCAVGQEIEFLGIPWESSVEDVRKTLRKEGYLSGTMQTFNDMGYYLKKQNNGVGLTSDGKARMEVTFVPAKQIAGYDTYVSLTFAGDDTNSALVYVRITFKCENEQEAFEDLETKLAGIYGKTKRVKKKVNNLPVLEDVWFGEHNTALWLYLYDDDEPTLHYGKTNAKDIIKSIPAKSNHVDPKNTTGLSVPTEQALVATKSSPLSMRTSPNNGGSIVTKIAKGETVDVIERGDWAHISYNGKQGYVNAQYLSYLDNDTQSDTESTVGLIDGTYVAFEADAGISSSNLTLTMTIKDGKIKDVKAEGDGSAFTKKNVLNNSIIALCEQIVDEQSVEIDVVSGVTYSGNAVLKAAQNCYVQAGGILTIVNEEVTNE